MADVLDDFLDRTLAQIDDLYELKVTLVALRLLDRKQVAQSSVTARELEAQPALRDGLGALPRLELDRALQRAVARGTLLCSAALGQTEPRYFANTDAARAHIEQLERALMTPATPTPSRDSAPQLALNAASREIERLEQVEVYARGANDEALVADWLGRGYTSDEIVSAVRAALRQPRAKGTPARTLAFCAKAIEASPPAQPSEFYAVVVARTRPPSEAIVNARERLGRLPTAREFDTVMSAVNVFGVAATLRGLKQATRAGALDLDALLPLMAESEEASDAAARKEAASSHDAVLRELVQLYEASLGLPPTSFVMDDMRASLHDQPDIELWRAAFARAAGQNKKSWAYVRTVARNPSSDLLTPAPSNDTAKAAFEMYRRRVNRLLDASVAREINALSAKVADARAWETAFDKAAAANSLNWNYIRVVLQGESKPRSGVPHANSRPSAKTAQRSARRTQVQYSEEDRAAARERARQRIAERQKQRDGK